MESLYTICYRSELKKIIQDYFLKKPNLSLQILAEKSQIKSKGFLSDVCSKKKHLSLPTLLRIFDALEVNDIGRSLILNLFYKEKPRLRPKHLLESDLDDRLKKINKFHTENDIKHSHLYYENIINLLVFASLGSDNHPRTIQEIVKMTGLMTNEVLLAIDVLVKLNLCLVKGDKYFAKAFHLNFDGDKIKSNFQNLYIERIKFLEKNAKPMFENKKNLFLYSVYSIDNAQLSKFRLELKALLEKYIEATESPRSKTLYHLLVSAWVHS